MIVRLVAAFLAAQAQRMSHYSNAEPLPLRVDGDVLDHPGGRPPVCELVYDQRANVPTILSARIATYIR